MLRRTRRGLSPLIDEVPERFGLRGVAADIAESDEEFTVTMDLPGFEDDDIDLRVTDHTLHVEAEREEERESGGGEEYLRRERGRRSVSRTVRLPEDIEREEAEATYTNGVLTVTVPKEHEEVEGHHVPISHGED